MTTSQIKAAASRLVDFAGAAGGSDHVKDIADNGYHGEIQWTDLLGYEPSDDDQTAVREQCRAAARNELCNA